MADSLDIRQVRPIKARLEAFATGLGKTWYEFTRETGLAHSTTSVWRNSRKAALPSVAMLVRLAERYQLSLDWLLLGVGGDVRGTERPATELSADVRLHVESALGIPADARGEGNRNALLSGEAMLAGLVEESRKRVEQAQEVWLASLPVELARRFQASNDPSARMQYARQIVAFVLHQSGKKGVATKAR